MKKSLEKPGFKCKLSFSLSVHGTYRNDLKNSLFTKNCLLKKVFHRLRFAIITKNKDSLQLLVICIFIIFKMVLIFFKLSH